MAFRRRIGMLALTGLLVLPFAFLLDDVQAQGQTQPGWEQQAEEQFRLGPGMGRRLMTEQEWREHWQKMQTMTPEERQKYRGEWHQKMVERARERGITMPEKPGPYGPGGPGGGMGPGGGQQRGGGRPY